MKTQTVFRLGALAALVTAVGIGVGEVIYIFGLGSVETVAYEWFSIVITIFQVFAVIALYTVQVKRGTILTFIGFVLLMVGLMFYLMDSVGDLGVLTGLLTQTQLDQAGQINSFIVLGAIANWSLNVGTIIFGYGTFRAGVFPRWAGILLLFVGVAIILRDIPGVESMFAVLSVVAWGWLGWALWTNPNPAMTTDP